MLELKEWDTFCVIVGSAAGALIGLQFVVITLVAERPALRVAEAGAAFATPTIVHFCAVLLLSAVLRAPWQAITPVAVLWGLLGLGGIAYTVVVARHMRLQTAYRPVFVDWVSNVLLPLTAYALLALSALAAPSHMQDSLFAAGVAALLLLFIAIYNAWDAVTYHVFVQRLDVKGESSGKDKP